MAFTPVTTPHLLGFDPLDSLRMDSARFPSASGLPAASSGGPQQHLSSRLDLQLSCAICLERYDEPRILMCSHSFCRRCLVKVLERRLEDPENPQPGDHLTCPKCRAVTVLSELGVDALPINWDLMQVVDIVGEDEGDMLDPDPFSSSQLQSLLPSQPSPAAVPNCREHNRLLDYFCDECDMLVCATCAINAHGGHKPKEAQHLMSELRSQCVDPLEIRFLRTNVAIDEATRISSQLRKLGEGHKHRIQSLFQEIREALTSRELALMQAVDGIISKKCAALGTQCAQLQRMREKLNDEKEHMARLLQVRDSDYAILMKKKQIVSEVNSVMAEVDQTDTQPVERVEDGPECLLRDGLLQEACEFGEIFCTPAPSQFVASGAGLEKGSVGKEVEFQIEAHDKYGQRAFKGGNKIEVVILDPQGASLPFVMDNAKRGRTLVKYTPTKVGFYTITIHVDSQKIYNHQTSVMVYGCRDYSVMAAPRECLTRQHMPDMSTVKSVCVLPVSGHLAFADQLCVRVATMEGRLVKRAITLPGLANGQFSMPLGLAASCRDDLFISDRQTRKIIRISSEGKVTGSFGGQGNKPGSFSHPEAIAVATDKLFVVDTGNHCVQVVPLRAGKLRVIGGRYVGSGMLQLRDPQGVAVDESRGHLYITDAGYNCLLCISLTTFEPIPSFGQSGEVPLINPSSVAVDRDGFVLVTSAKSHLLSIISPQGSKVKQLGAEGVLLKSPSSVCVDQTGNVIVVDNAVPCIYIF